MEDEYDLWITKTPKRRHRLADQERRQSPERQPKQNVRHGPLTNRNQNNANLDQNQSSSNRSQEYKNLGAIPKTIRPSNRKPVLDRKPFKDQRRGIDKSKPDLKPIQDWEPLSDQRRGIDRSEPDLTRHPETGAVTSLKDFQRQSSPIACIQSSAPGTGRTHVRPLAYTRLTELNESDMNKRELALRLISRKSGFVELLNQDTIRPDSMKPLLSIIVKACSSARKKYVWKLLKMIVQSKFLENHITAGFLLQFRHSRLQDQLELMQCVDNTITLLGEILVNMPTFVDKCEAVTIMLDKIPDKLTALEANTIDLLKAKIISISNRVSDILSTNPKDDQIFTKGERRKCEDADIELENIPPHIDYRQMSIYPTNEDIHMERPAYARANKERGRFNDHNHYLDVQFRLLREEYIQPMRTGIKEYLKTVAAGKPETELTEAKTYNDVKIFSPKCTPAGIVYRIQFDTTPFSRIRWQKSKLLSFGSLVCLSHDNFATLFFAVVTGRDIIDLQNGFVDIRFTEFFDIGGKDTKDVYVMLEPTTFFEAYRHVLECLQEIIEVPFQRYIVSGETEVRPPRYLLGQYPNYDLQSPPNYDLQSPPNYDLQSLSNYDLQSPPNYDLQSPPNYDLQSPPNFDLQSPLNYDLTCCLAEDVPRSERVGASVVPVLKTSEWPTKNALCFDDSQLQAVKTALTKEFAVIQGLTGTGKTYVGLKIARALLENDAAWGRESPLLVVCHTNHVLDQFLEGMLDFGLERLIRVGGMSTSERLEKHTLKNRKFIIKDNNETRQEILDGVRYCWREINFLEKQVLEDWRGERLLDDDQRKHIVEQMELVTNRLKSVRDDEDFDILSKAKVIGMTISKAARCRNLLKRIMPKVIIVEEATEVFESHIISFLNSSCEHLILIGNQKLQKRPAMFEPTQSCKLDFALFERMAHNRVRCDTLQLQHRMRPEIAEIIASIYPQLGKHQSVERSGHVKIVSSDIFFLKHHIPEAIVEDTKSRSNHHVRTRLCLHGRCVGIYFFRDVDPDTDVTIGCKKRASTRAQVSRTRQAFEGKKREKNEGTEKEKGERRERAWRKREYLNKMSTVMTVNKDMVKRTQKEENQRTKKEKRGKKGKDKEK